MATTDADDSPLIPVFVLTGYLGSGKTTILAHWIAHEEFANTLVVINEFGQIGLDHRLVTQSEDSATVVMDSGCICCTIRTDLVKTLEQARWRFARQGQRQFDRVVIETTGLADPAPIVQTLTTEARLMRHYRLQSVLTSVDLVLGEQTLKDHEEGPKQVAMADQLLLTKADLLGAPPRRDDPLLMTLEQLNPWAPMHVLAQGKAPLALLRTDQSVSVMQYRQRMKPRPGSGHSHAINALCLSCAGPIPLDVVERWQEQVMALLGADLFRLKAIVEVCAADGRYWVVMQSVQHKAMPITRLYDLVAGNVADEPMSSQFVLIGQHLSIERLAPSLTDALPLVEAEPGAA